MANINVKPILPKDHLGVDGITKERLRTIVQDCNLNFLIGSGTSTPFFSILGDIETALTELTSRGIEKTQEDLVRASLQGLYFAKVIGPNLSLMKQDEASRSTRTSYEQFLRTIYRILVNRRSSLLGKQVNFFTTNIDMMFEVALESLGIDGNDGFCGKINPRLDLSEFNTLKFRQGIRYGYRSEVPTVNLLKLHGSVAWLDNGGQIFFDHGLSLVAELEKQYEAAKTNLLTVDDPTSIDLDVLIKSAEDKTLDDYGQLFADQYSKLTIVNPEKTKFSSTVLNETYYELIRRFANEMERENTVLFVHGFSFRDEHLRDMVLRAAKTNPTLQVIIFCYSNSSRVELEGLLPSERVKNGNILFVSPLTPSEDNEEQKLTLDFVRECLFDPMNAAAPLQPDLRLELSVPEGEEQSE